DPSQLCTPLGQGGALSCMDAVIGKPATTDKNVLSAEARAFIGHFAVNPSVNVDITHKVTGIQMPVYFVSADDGGLIAGVTPSWRSDTRDFSAFVFVGGALSL